MAAPSITVRIHPKWVTAFRSQDMNLCCAFGFSANVKNDPYNVIAWAEAPTPINTITWTDEYNMAACKHGTDEGSKTTPNTDPLPISFGGTFTVDKEWKTLVKSNTAQSDPATWIRFHNETLAAGLVFKRVRNRILPVYLLGMGKSTMPPGRYDITPTGSLLLFFSSKKESMSFTEAYIETKSCAIKYTGHQRAEVVYTAEGTWEQPTSTRDEDEGYSISASKL